MLIKAERRILTHIHEGTNSWYRQLAPRLLMMFRRVLRSPTPPRRHTAYVGGGRRSSSGGNRRSSRRCRLSRCTKG
jgi:hypothetical protein